MSMENGETNSVGTKSRRKRYPGIKILFILVIAGMIAATIYMEKNRRAQMEESAPVRELHRSLVQRAAAMAETKNRRADFFKTRFFLDFPKLYAFGASDLIREISRAVPVGMRVLSIHITPGDQHLSFTYSICGDTAALAEFTRKLEDFDAIMNLSSAPQGNNTYKITGEAELL